MADGYRFISRDGGLFPANTEAQAALEKIESHTLVEFVDEATRAQHRYMLALVQMIYDQKEWLDDDGQPLDFEPFRENLKEGCGWGQVYTRKGKQRFIGESWTMRALSRKRRSERIDALRDLIVKLNICSHEELDRRLEEHRSAA